MPWLSAIALLLTSPPVSAAPRVSSSDLPLDEDVFELPLEDLMEVRIRAGSYVMAGPRQPVSMTVITREQIALSGARTLQEVLLAYVPGYFLIEDQDDVIAAFRGFSPDSNSKVMMLLDGRNLNTEWFMGPPDAVLNGLDVGYIERIEVSRGPGSVLLGQGSLLGVINIITRGVRPSSYARVDLRAGRDDYRGASAQASVSVDDAGAWFYGSAMQYGGQELRREGWPLQIDNPTGVLLIERGHRLRRARQQVAIVRLRKGHWEMNLSRFAQTRDAYNFYRDREEIDQQLTSLGLDYSHPMGRDVAIQFDGSYDRDEFGWVAHEGVRVAGTREDRWTGRALLTWDAPELNNKLAAGAELRRFEMGRRDRYGLNLIVNDLDSRALATNQENRFVEREDFHVASLFVEDNWTVLPWLALFAGLRGDLHPNWGARLSPRIGTWLTPIDSYAVRLSYQTGFRGAPGMYYAGGWRRDGFLQEEHLGAVEANPFVRALGFSNIPTAQPETIESLELETVADLTEGLTFDSVLFVNRLHNLIDVGVIYDPSFEAVPAGQARIGSDQIGDWGGWWYFKNNEGTITSGGAELTLRYSIHQLDVTVSESVARVFDVPAGLANGMYVTGTKRSPHFKAYPEYVTRLNTVLRPTERLVLGANALYYSQWRPPASSQGGFATGDPGFSLSMVANYRTNFGLDFSVTVKNLLRTQGLWPMNSNAGDRVVSAGSPSLESRTYWLSVGYEL